MKTNLHLYLWKKVNASLCWENWETEWPLDDYPMESVTVDKIVCEDWMWFYFESWWKIYQYYSDTKS